MNWVNDFDKITKFLNGIVMYTPEKVEDRAMMLYELYIGLKDAFQWGDEIYLNSALLTNCVISYYEDISREKIYHRIKRIDTHKKAAYTIKWVSKIRPICYTSDIDLDPCRLNANQIFAVWSGLIFLKGIKIYDIPINLYDNLLYTASYRDINPKELAQTMYLLEYYSHTKSPFHKKK